MTDEYETFMKLKEFIQAGLLPFLPLEAATFNFFIWESISLLTELNLFRFLFGILSEEESFEESFSLKEE